MVKKFTAKKFDGDDLYSWAIFKSSDVKGKGSIIFYGEARPLMTGLSRDFARHRVRELNSAAS